MTRFTLILLTLLFASRCVGEPPSVRATIEKEIAWTGEAVPLIITLYSPGPFSGTAAFELPELPRTAIVKAGSPLVGTQDVDGESYFTQRHSFEFYTQREGEIVIPRIHVRFMGKKTFTSEADPIDGSTPELRFQSNRPPDTENMSVVVCATEIQVSQKWTPDLTGDASERKFEAGDVIERTIVRTAEGTTAMMLPPVSAVASLGVRVYLGSADVTDEAVRGDSRAQRTDTLKYQFERPGTFSLPDVIFDWWDPVAEELKHQTLRGRTVVVADVIAETSSVDVSDARPPPIWRLVITGLLIFGVLVWSLREPIRQVIAHWQSTYNRPEARAVRQLRAACKSGDASTAYSALLAWLTAKQPTSGKDSVESMLGASTYDTLRQQWHLLSQHLFAPANDASPWDANELWAAFRQSPSRSSRSGETMTPSALPPLNPVAVAFSRSKGRGSGVLSLREF